MSLPTPPTAYLGKASIHATVTFFVQEAGRPERDSVIFKPHYSSTH